MGGCSSKNTIQVDIQKKINQSASTEDINDKTTTSQANPGIDQGFTSPKAEVKVEVQKKADPSTEDQSDQKTNTGKITPVDNSQKESRKSTVTEIKPVEHIVEAKVETQPNTGKTTPVDNSHQEPRKSIVTEIKPVEQAVEKKAEIQVKAEPPKENQNANINRSQATPQIEQESKEKTVTEIKPAEQNNEEKVESVVPKMERLGHFDETKIVKVVMQESSGKLVSEIHFNAGSAPLASIKDGGAYILYSDKSTSQLKVIQIDNDGNKTGSDMDLGVKGAPLDIITVSWGFVILGNDKSQNHKLFVMGFTKDGKNKFTRMLINTPKEPSAATKDQIMFKDKDGPLFGLKAIYDPHNGRLAWLNGRIAVIFAHYNFFGMKGGSRDVHTGDTFITLDEDGQDEKLGWAWGTSHSLNQQIVAHEDYYITVSLGDAYPVNIKGQRVWNNQEKLDVEDPTTKKRNRLANISNDLIDGCVVGNGQGGSCGRLGGLVYLKSKNLFAFAYSRRKCTDSYGGHKYVNAKNELAIVFMDEMLNVVKTAVIGDGEFINLIKMAKCGTNLLIQYNTTDRRDPRYASKQYLHYETATTDKTYMLMVDFDGNVVTAPKLMTGMHASPSDDFEELSDGRVAWTYVDPSNGQVNYYYYGLPLNEDRPVEGNNAELAQKPENVKKKFNAIGMTHNIDKVPAQLISPLNPIINTSEKSVTVKLKFPSSVGMWVDFEDMKGKKYEGLTRISKEGDDMNIVTALLPGKGEFKICTIVDNKTSREWIDFYVNSTMEEEVDASKLGFPTVFGGTEDIVLLEPLTKYLKKGSTQHFKFKSSKATDIIVIINGKWIKLPKNGDIFEGDVEVNEKEGGFNVWAQYNGSGSIKGALQYEIYS